MGTPRITENGFRAAASEWGEIRWLAAPSPDWLVRRLAHRRAAFVRGYLKFFVDHGTLTVREADEVMSRVCKAHWYVRCYPRWWTTSLTRWTR